MSQNSNLLSSFFAHRLTQQVKELYSSTLILNFAIASVTIFEPVFLFLVLRQQFELKLALQLVLVFYLAVYVLYFAVLPLGAKFARWYGYEHSMALSTIFTALFYLSFFGISRSFLLAPVAVILYVLWKIFYWPAYHSNFALFSVDGEQGRQISNLMALQTTVAIFGPLIGGVILKYLGFEVLFVLAAILMVLSNIPMLITKEKFKPADFSYFDAYRRLFKWNTIKRFFALTGFGEELIILVIWPIFIYLAVKDFLGLGALVAVSTFFTTVVYLYIGRATDGKDRRAILRSGTISYFMTWLLRILARSVMGIFLVDVFSRITKQSIAIPMIATTYENAQDTSVMKTVLFFEMSLVVGKIVAILLSLVLLEIFVPGWNAMFFLAGAMTLLYLLF